MRNLAYRLTFFVLAAFSLGRFAHAKDICFEGGLGPLLIQTDGVTRNGEFYPFGREAIVDDEKFAKTFRMNPDQITTRMAIDLRQQSGEIVFVEAERRSEKKTAFMAPSTWKQLVTQDYQAYPKIHRFRYNYVAFDKKFEKAKAQFAFVNHYNKNAWKGYEGFELPDIDTPKVTIEQLVQPNLLAQPMFKDFFPRMKSLEMKFGYFYQDNLKRSSNCLLSEFVP